MDIYIKIYLKQRDTCICTYVYVHVIYIEITFTLEFKNNFSQLIHNFYIYSLRGYLSVSILSYYNVNKLLYYNVNKIELLDHQTYCKPFHMSLTDMLRC